MRDQVSRRLLSDRVRWAASLELGVESDWEAMVPTTTLTPHQSEPFFTPPDHARLLEVAVTSLGPGAAIDEIAKLFKPSQRFGDGFPFTDDDLDTHTIASCTADTGRIPEAV